MGNLRVPQQMVAQQAAQLTGIQEAIHFSSSQKSNWRRAEDIIKQHQSSHGTDNTL